MRSSKKAVPEITPEQFEVVARLLKTKEPVRTAARMVLLHGEKTTVAAALTGIHQPSVSRAACRIRREHEAIVKAYLCEPSDT